MEAPIASTDALTIREMSRLGWMAEKVEHWIPYTERRKDLFSVFDQLAICPAGEVYFVQTTSRSNHASRRNKVRASAVLPRLLENPRNHVEIWSWDKKDNLKREVIESTAVPGARERSQLRRGLTTPSDSTPASESGTARLLGASVRRRKSGTG